jgi:hypothetical protein
VDAKVDSQEKSEHRSWRRWAIGSTVVLLLFLMPVATLYVYAASLESEANRQIAELDRSEPGWRTVPAEPTPLPDQESIRVLNRAAGLVPAMWRESAERVLYIDNAPPPCLLSNEVHGKLDAAMARCSAAVSMARSLNDLPTGRYPALPLLDGMSRNAGKMQDYRELAYALEYAAFDFAQRGDHDAAWRISRAQLNLARPLQDGDYSVGLARIAIEQSTVASVERVLALGECPEAELASMQKELAEENEADRFFPYMPEDAATALRKLDDLLTGRVRFEPFGPEVPVGWWGRLNERVPRVMLLQSKIESVRRLAAAYRIRSLRGFDRYEAMSRLSDEFGAKAVDFTLGHAWMLPISVLRYEQESRAWLGCTIAGLAAERHRLKHGRWPASTKELEATGLLTRMPEDPYDGKPLRMRLAPDGLVIYSVGSRKTYDGCYLDDFSEMLKEGRSTAEFRLWNPDRRRQPTPP